MVEGDDGGIYLAMEYVPYSLVETLKDDSDAPPDRLAPLQPGSGVIVAAQVTAGVAARTSMDGFPGVV